MVDFAHPEDVMVEWLTLSSLVVSQLLSPHGIVEVHHIYVTNVLNLTHCSCVLLEKSAV